MSSGSATQINGYGTKWTQGLLPVLLVGAGGLLVGVLISVGVGPQKVLYMLALVAILLAIKWPVQIALGLVALSLPFDAILVVWSGAGVTTLTWFISAGAGALLLARILTGVRQAPPRVAMWWFLLMAWTATTSLWALDTRPAVKRLPMALSLLIFYLVAVSSRITRKQLNFVVGLAILGGSIAAGWAFWSYLHGMTWEGGRASLTLDNREMDPNYFAAMLLLPFSLAIGMFLSVRKRIVKLLLALAVGLTGLSIFLSMSRGALVALISLVSVYGYRLGVRLRTVAVVLVVLALLAAAAPASFWERLQPDRMRTGSGRTDIWLAGTQMLKKNLLWGVGIANFPVAYNSYAGAGPKFQGYFRDSHNTYLNIMAEEGLIGLALFFVALVYQFRLRPAVRDSAAAPAAMLVSCQATLVGLLAAAFFIDFLYTKVFWFTLMLCTVISRVNLSPEGSASEHSNTLSEHSPVDPVFRDTVFTR